MPGSSDGFRIPYSNLHSLPAHEFHASHDILLHLHELRKLLCKVGAECAGGRPAECVPCGKGRSANKAHNSPISHANAVAAHTNVASTKETAGLR
jgi:hypothetical protein